MDKPPFNISCLQSAPGSPVKGGCSGSLIFTVLSAPPLPQVHRVRGGGRSVPENSKEHRWASSMFFFYSEFSVESGSLRAASPGLLVCDTFYTLQECSSLLPAQLICLPREGAKLCIAVEVTCHLQITSTSEGGNCSS